MLRTRENHHDPTSLLFCTLYYLKNIPRIRPRLQRCQQAERSGNAFTFWSPTRSSVLYAAKTRIWGSIMAPLNRIACETPGRDSVLRS